MILTNYVLISVIGIVVAIILIIALWFIAVRNTLAKMVVDIANAESRIDVYLTKRFDLLTKMLQTTKGYAKHEKETLEEIVAMRNPGTDASLQEKAQFDSALSEASKKINIVVERYPDLKANTVFMKLQDSINEVEENLQAARSNYNQNVAVYNKKIVVFPTSIVAGSRFTKRDFFEADEAKKEDVKMEF